MARPHSTRSPRHKKPAKPYADFPLYAHAGGCWAKKIRGQTHYFGPWSDWQGALETYRMQVDDLQAGRKPRDPRDDRATVRDMVNRFLTNRQRQADSGEIKRETFEDYLKEAERIIGHFGRERTVADIMPEDFAEFRAAIAKGVNATTLANRVRRCRAFFNYAQRNRLIDRVEFGDEFNLPSAAAQNRARRRHGPRDLSPETVRTLINRAKSPHFRAMLWLGINGGYGNTDCAELRPEWIDLEGGWIREPRQKTGSPRIVPLWDETVAAMEESRRKRPRPRHPNAKGLFFVTKYGQPWVMGNDNAVCKEFAALRKRCGIERATFYDLRRTFETIGDQTRDLPAVSTIMGHKEQGMAARYRQRVADDQLRAVANHVRAWLLSEGGAENV